MTTLQLPFVIDPADHVHFWDVAIWIYVSPRRKRHRWKKNVVLMCSQNDLDEKTRQVALNFQNEAPNCRVVIKANQIA